MRVVSFVPSLLAALALIAPQAAVTPAPRAPRTTMLRATDTPAATAPSAALRTGFLQDDIDAFMEVVLEKRAFNWDQVYDYVFGEVEMLRIRGSEIAALQSFDREYTWYVRDGYLVRSPWKVNDVEVDDESREQAELQWIAGIEEDGERAPIERDSFFDFEFEPGNYLFAGREMFEGREVVRIEYYPTNLLSEGSEEAGSADTEAGAAGESGGRAGAAGDSGGRAGAARNSDGRAGSEGTETRSGGIHEDEDFDEEEFEHMFDKTSLVTMLVIPEEHQIVKWTFENVGFEFLPYRWLVRMEELHASMVMDQPVEGVWLPREIEASASASTAGFDLTVEYRRAFFDYKRTAVGAGVVFGRPKGGR